MFTGTHIAVQVGDVEFFVVNRAYLANPEVSELLADVGAKTASANNRHLCSTQPVLTILAEEADVSIRTFHCTIVLFLSCVT